MDPFSSAMLLGTGYLFGTGNRHSSNVHTTVNVHCRNNESKKIKLEEKIREENRLKEEQKENNIIVYGGEVVPSKPEKIVYKKNKFGNFEMSRTRFVMDTKTKLIIGVRKTNGSIDKWIKKNKHCVKHGVSLIKKLILMITNKSENFNKNS